MMPHNRQHLELTFYADLVRFISDPTPLAYNRLLRILDILAIAMPLQRTPDQLVQIHSARRAMTAILDRFERTGTLAITRLDEITLRAATPHIEAAIGRVQLGAFSFANALVQHKMQQQGVALTD